MSDDLPAFLLARIGEYQDDARRAANPLRVAEYEAKRRIVELHESVPHHLGTYCDECGDLDNAGDPIPYWPCQTMRLLALPYRDHPDYRPEWAPEQQ